MWSLEFLFFIGFFFIYLFLFAVFLFFFYCGGIFYSFQLFNIMGVDVSFDLVFDFISFGFFMCVSVISSLVFLYSLFYMSMGSDLRRFYSLVFLFVFSMFILVFSGNFFFVMVGWDGLGLVSFCLVIFYNNKFVLESGLVTIFSNRVGDCFFLIAFFVFFFGCFGFTFCDFYCMLFFCLLIFLGSITKSAQIPFSAWLPAAMAAPTPVSSLVHSSTLVTAGLYVIIRFNYMFYFFNFFVFCIFSLFTMVMAGACAAVETDLKKVVAMSTLSQLGMMLFVISSGLWVLSFLHMIIHAFFKSMLFLSTGSLMGQISGTQDSRFFGSGVYNFGSFFCFFVSGLCLSGFPFFIGFYSKDFIISNCSSLVGFVIYFVFLLGCILTVYYSIRLIFVSYFLFLKGFVFFSLLENIFYFIFVSILSTICWFIGGLFYWFFLVDFIFFFGCFDYLTGIFLLIFGLILFIFLKIFGFMFFSLSNMMFFKWIGGSMLSYSKSYLFYYKLDMSWLEYLGGGGIFKILFSLNNYFYVISKMAMVVLVFSFFYCFYF